MELAIDDPIKRAQQHAINPNNFKGSQAPLSNNPGIGTQMANMAKQQLMQEAVTKGTGALTGAGSSALAGSGMGTAAMTAMPYVGAGLLAGKAFGLFNEGGKVGPLSMKYYTDMYNKYFPTKDMKDMGEPPAFTDRGVVRPNIQPDTGMPTGQDMRRYSNDLSHQSFKDMYNALQQATPTRYKSQGGYSGADTLRSYIGRNPEDARSALLNEYRNRNRVTEEELARLTKEHNENEKNKTPFEAINQIFFGNPYPSEEQRQINFDRNFKEEYGDLMSQLPPQYKSQGGMTEADARALMNNQPNPDQLYDEIIMEQVGPLARPQIRDPYGADRTHSPYEMIRPDNAPNT